MKLKWNEIEPDTYEARVGDWLLEVGRHDDGLPWTLWVGLLNERAHGADPTCGTTYRRTVTGSLDEAQRAAVALAVEKCAPFAATARAEAALAEREACAEVLDAEIAALRALGYERDEGGMSVVGWRIKSVRAALDAIRARTTPATLSTDTLAAIAEARGLRLVEPELVAEVPLLRWDVEQRSVARLGQWVLEVGALSWAVYVDSPTSTMRMLVAGETSRAANAVNRRAAEDALRKLGVAFRTE